MKIFTFTKTVIALALAFPAMTHAGIFDDTEARKQIQAIRSEQQAQSKNVDNLRQESRTANQKQDDNTQALIERINTLEQNTRSQARQLLELNNQINDVKSDISKIRGDLEVATFNTETLQKRQKDYYVDLDNRLRTQEQALSGLQNRLQVLQDTPAVPSPSPAPTVVREPAVSSAPSSSKPKPSAVPVSKSEPNKVAPSVGDSERNDKSSIDKNAADEKAYQAALAIYRKGNYAEAIAAFEQFLSKYPKSDEAPNAQYWIGFSYSAMRQWSDAIEAQKKVLKYYPDSTKVPDALLNIAGCQLEQKNPDGARKTLGVVVNKFPGTSAADQAKRQLANIK